MSVCNYIENIVLRFLSEKIGCAVNLYHGVMEYRSAGVLGLVEIDLFLKEYYGAENKLLAAERF